MSLITSLRLQTPASDAVLIEKGEPPILGAWFDLQRTSNLDVLLSCIGPGAFLDGYQAYDVVDVTEYQHHGILGTCGTIRMDLHGMGSRAFCGVLFFALGKKYILGSTLRSAIISFSRLVLSTLMGSSELSRLFPLRCKEKNPRSKKRRRV